MKLLFNLSQIGRTRGVGDFGLFSFNENKPSNAYVPTAGCVLDHILLAKNLSDLEKLYYILANSLSSINLYGGGKRAIGLSAISWAKRLDCAKSKVFAMQRSLEEKGYFILSKDKDKYGHNKRNLICPTLPDDIFYRLLRDSKGRAESNELIYNPNHESKLQFLDRTKLFIILGYQVLKNIAACPYLTSFHKVVWLDFYTICYKARIGNLGALLIDDDRLDFSFIASYKQLEEKYSCTKSLLSKTLIDLQELGLIKREQFYTKKEQGDQERQDKSLWKISLISSSMSGSPSTGAKGQGGGPHLSSGCNDSGFSLFHPQSPLFSKLHSHKAGSNARVYDSNNSNTLDSNSTMDSFPVNYGGQYTKGNSPIFVDDDIGTYNIGIQSTYNPNSPKKVLVVNFDNCKLLPNPKNNNSFESFISSDANEDIEDYTNKSSDKINTASNTSFLGSSNQPDQPEFNISYTDPEITSSNLYNNTNLNKHIYKSNNVYVDNTNCSENNKNKTSITQSTTQNVETIKNGWQNVYGGYDAARTDFKGVFKSKIFLKEKIRKISKFSVSDLLIKEKLKLLSRDKANKARKFAYSLFSKGIVKGYASTLSKHELAKQFIFHATSWRPTKIARGAREDELVDIALSVAWNAVVSGGWSEPLEWAKAKALQYEFLDYKRKYRDSGIISNELGSLETMINNFLGDHYNLTAIITNEVKQEMEAEEVKHGDVGEVIRGDIYNIPALNGLNIENIKDGTVNLSCTGESNMVLRNLISKIGNQPSKNFGNSQNLLYHYEEVNTVSIVKGMNTVQMSGTTETTAVCCSVGGTIGVLHNKRVLQNSYTLDRYYNPDDNTVDSLAAPPVTSFSHSNNVEHALTDEELNGSELMLSHNVKIKQKGYISKNWQYTKDGSAISGEIMDQGEKLNLTQYKYGHHDDNGRNVRKSLWAAELDLCLRRDIKKISSDDTYGPKDNRYASKTSTEFTKIDKALNDILGKIMKKN